VRDITGNQIHLTDDKFIISFSAVQFQLMYDLHYAWKQKDGFPARTWNEVTCGYKDWVGLAYRRGGEWRVIIHLQLRW